MQDMDLLAREIVKAARAAGRIALARREGGLSPVRKADGTPVTAADREMEEMIAAALFRLAPGVPVVGEESVSEGRVPDISGGRFFLVDPLDGTRDYIAGGADFTVNVALLENARPVMGVIHAPVSGDTYYAAGGRAFVLRGGAPALGIRVRRPPPEGLTVLTSRRHDDPEDLRAYLRDVKVAARVKRSSSIKCCLVAEGAADLYPRLSPTCEWDTAAGEAIVAAAGGRMHALDGTPLLYGKTDARFLNPSFVARA